MTDAEDRLRGWLRRGAEHAPRGQFMLDRVRRESARRTRRRRVAATGGLAAVMAVSILVVMTITGRSTPTPPPPGNHGVTFVAGARVYAAFPLRVPAGSGYSTTVATLVAARPTLVLAPLRAPRTLLTLTVGTGPPPPGAKPVRVGALPVSMAWNGTQKASGYTVWWTPPTGGWATIAAPPDYSLNLIAKILSGLGAGSMPGAEPFTFATVPDGFVADNIDPTRVTFCPAGTPPDPSSAGKILVRLDETPLPGAGRQVTVAGRPARLTTTGGATVLRVAEDPGQTLTVRVPATIHINTTDLLRFAAGIHPTGPPASR